MKNLNDRFLELCQEFERAANVKYDLKNSQNPYGYVAKLAEFNAHEGNIESIRHIRNIFSHARRIDGVDIATVSERTLDYLQELIDMLETPLTALDVASTEVAMATPKDRIVWVMRQMTENGYSHFPVAKKGVVTGVFSENTLFRYLLRFQQVRLDKGLRIEDFNEFLHLDSNTNRFYKFTSRKTSVVELKAMFRMLDHKGRKLAAVFVTENGDPSEKLMGIVTPWDVVDVGHQE